jgi:hypothetical protein
MGGKTRASYKQFNLGPFNTYVLQLSTYMLRLKKSVNDKGIMHLGAVGMITNWREIVVEVLSEKLGPVAVVIVNDVANNMGITSSAIDSKTYAGFLMKLAREMPPRVYSIEIIRLCRNRIAL